MRFLVALLLMLMGFGCTPNSERTIPEKPTAITWTTELDSLNRANQALVPASDEERNKILVFLPDSTARLPTPRHRIHRIWGYAKPDTTSQKLILFSVFTNDVEGNPFGLKLGSYYDLAAHTGSTALFNGKQAGFVQLRFTTHENTSNIYVPAAWADIISN